MPQHLRPRCATLTLELDGDAAPTASDLLLSTRAGETVWRGEAGPAAWHAGLRLRARWQGTWDDALWAMTLAVLDAELAVQGLRRDGDPRVDVRPAPHGPGTLTQVVCPVVPCRLHAEVVLGPDARTAIGV